jgi:hypothetical protein
MSRAYRKCERCGHRGIAHQGDDRGDRACVAHVKGLGRCRCDGFSPVGGEHRPKTGAGNGGSL